MIKQNSYDSGKKGNLQLRLPTRYLEVTVWSTNYMNTFLNQANAQIILHSKTSAEFTYFNKSGFLLYWI
jgi:hypothetical protein